MAILMLTGFMELNTNVHWDTATTQVFLTTLKQQPPLSKEKSQDF